VTLIACEECYALRGSCEVAWIDVEESDDDMASSDQEGIVPQFVILKRVMPKIHTHGDSRASSGRKKWKSVLNQLEALFSSSKLGVHILKSTLLLGVSLSVLVSNWS
jgi:hypothetical protein